MQQRFLLQILLLAEHVSGITMPIIRSSRVLYRILLYPLTSIQVIILPKRRLDMKFKNNFLCLSNPVQSVYVLVF